MKPIDGINRDLLTLMPDSIEDYISVNNPVWLLDTFVDSLDLNELGFSHTKPEAHGRPPYHPGHLIRLYLYEHIYAIRPSRTLECEAHRNLEVIWLLKELAPDQNTIADIHKRNGDTIHQVCREFIYFCKRSDLIGGELVAIDGSKFKASNARDRNFSCAKLTDRLK